MGNTVRPKVLVVDDEVKLLESYQFFLKSAGFDVSTAENGKEATRIVTEERHELALIDLRIKDENGITLAETLKQVDSSMEITIITAYPSHETAVKALKIGAYDYLSKTSESESIITTLNEALAEREVKLMQLNASASEDSLKISVICDNTFIKQGLLSFTAKCNSIQILDFYFNIPRFIKTYKSSESDIVLVCGSCNFDAFSESLKLISKIKMVMPDTHIIIFNHSLNDYQQTELIKCGISGFLEDKLSEDKTQELLFKVKEGELLAPRNIISKALKDLSTNYYSHEEPEDTPLETELYLTDREKDIMKCIARGLKNRDIADQLCISEKTVKTHINNIFRKLEVENRLQAINLVYQKNLLF